jgi:hypothetical protein
MDFIKYDFNFESVVLNSMYHIAERMNKHHIENFNQLNKQIWLDYFNCMVQLASDSCLQLENFNENKQKIILNKYKDLRVKATLEIKKMWYNLGKRLATLNEKKISKNT